MKIFRCEPNCMLAMFKPNISPVLLDQIPVTESVTKITESGEKVIVDADATTERVMLWFYLLINVGGFMGAATANIERYIGWWVAYFIPLVLYMPLPFLLYFLRNRVILLPPGGSDLGNVVRILGICFRRGGLRDIFSKNGDFFAHAKPSVIARSQYPMEVPWNDDFVDDVKRAFGACAIFCFIPIQFINDNGLGGAANIQSNMLLAKGAANDMLSNFNSLVIIVGSPFLNYILYPTLRKMRIEYGPIARITTGLCISTLSGLIYTLINIYAYRSSPCGNMGTSNSCVDENGHALVSNVSLWVQAIPFSIGGFSELFVLVPAFGLAYSRSPKNMRGLVSALNLCGAGVAYALGLAFSAIIKDPYLTW
jgi:dipeptide/tripeptide permease